jgi:hypothetical protein
VVITADLQCFACTSATVRHSDGMAFHRFQLAGATFLLLCLALTAGCANKTRQDTTAPMGPGAEQGGAGSDGTNSVTNSTAEGEPGADSDAGSGSDAGAGSGAGEPGTSGATGTAGAGGGVSGPPT